jgi:hypothetical protein
VFGMALIGAVLMIFIWGKGRKGTRVLRNDDTAEHASSSEPAHPSRWTSVAGRGAQQRR